MAGSIYGSSPSPRGSSQIGVPELNNTIMIIGNGPITGAAAMSVAQSDIVIRFNACRSFTDAPGRTDVVAVCNTGRPGKEMISSSTWRDHPAVRAASEIWCVRDPIKFAEMRRPLALSHPDLDDFCDDYTDGFASFAAETGKVIRVLDRSIHEAIDARLRTYDPAPYVVPSSGLIIIAEILRTYPGHHVSLAGFSHEGWIWHPFAVERRLVDSFVAEGRVRRVGESAAAEPSAKATAAE